MCIIKNALAGNRHLFSLRLSVMQSSRLLYNWLRYKRTMHMLVFSAVLRAVYHVRVLRLPHIARVYI